MLVSYAQNFEDVMLWRALNSLETGFYIDVGAAWPTKDSVTKLFYDRQWHGINVEPNPILFLELETERTRDTNLQVALSDSESSMIIHVIEDSGLSTLDPDIAQAHSASGHKVVELEVQISTLAALWAKHVPDGQEVHFLKIDVEGFERSVLLGMNWSKNRPWIVVVEATVPTSQVEVHDEWETVVTGAGYEFAYADGINRFYVANERSELRSLFKYPPNIFDGFVRQSEVESEKRAVATEVRLVHALDDLRRRVHSEELAARRNEWLENELVVAHREAEHVRQELVKCQIGSGSRLALVESNSEHARLELESKLVLATLSRSTQGQDALRSRDERSRAELATKTLQVLQLQTDLTLGKAASSQHIDDLQRQIHQMFTSRSWRVTAPLRSLTELIRWLRCGAKRIVRRTLLPAARPILTWMMVHTLQHRHFANAARFALASFPRTRSRIHHFGLVRGFISVEPVVAAKPPAETFATRRAQEQLRSALLERSTRS
jgi:FkbM family methyltransferase